MSRVSREFISSEFGLTELGLGPDGKRRRQRNGGGSVCRESDLSSRDNRG